MVVTDHVLFQNVLTLFRLSALLELRFSWLFNKYLIIASSKRKKRTSLSNGWQSSFVFGKSRPIDRHTEPFRKSTKTPGGSCARVTVNRTHSLPLALYLSTLPVNALQNTMLLQDAFIYSNNSWRKNMNSSN